MSATAGEVFRGSSSHLGALGRLPRGVFGAGTPDATAAFGVMQLGDRRTHRSIWLVFELVVDAAASRGQIGSVSKTEVMVTIMVDGAPVAEVVAGFASLADLGVAMQAIERALRPEVASWSGWSCSKSEPSGIPG